MESLYQPERPVLDVVGFAWRHKGMMLLTFVAGMALTLGYLSFATRKFQSDAKLLVRIGRETVTLDPTATTGQYVAVAESRDGEMHAVEELLGSRATAEKIVDQFGPGVILEKRKKSTGPSFSDRPTAHGVVTVDANVDTRGIVTSTRLISNTTGDPALAALAEKEIRNARFVAPVRNCVAKAFIFTYKRSF